MVQYNKDNISERNQYLPVLAYDTFVFVYVLNIIRS